MNEFVGGRVHTPWHLWVVGVIALLWNAFGCFDYVMTETVNEDYLSSFTEEQIEYFVTMPVWRVAIWAIGVWGGLAAAGALLLRNRWAVALFAISLAAAILANIVGFFDPVAREMMGGATMVITIVIIVIGAFELWYSWAMRKRGVLR